MIDFCENQRQNVKTSKKHLCNITQHITNNDLSTSTFSFPLFFLPLSHLLLLSHHSSYGFKPPVPLSTPLFSLHNVVPTFLSTITILYPFFFPPSILFHLFLSPPPLPPVHLSHASFPCGFRHELINASPSLSLAVSRSLCLALMTSVLGECYCGNQSGAPQGCH